MLMSFDQGKDVSASAIHGRKSLGHLAPTHTTDEGNYGRSIVWGFLHFQGIISLYMRDGRIKSSVRAFSGRRLLGQRCGYPRTDQNPTHEVRQQGPNKETH